MRYSEHHIDTMIDHYMDLVETARTFSERMERRKMLNYWLSEKQKLLN